MDTNSNSKFSLTKWASAGIGTLLILLIFSIISVGVYAPIKDYLFKYDTKEYIESSNFNYALADLTRYLKDSKLRNSNETNTVYENIQSIKYLIESKDKGFIASNLTSPPAEERNNSQFYLHMTTDVNSKPTIESSLGSAFDKTAFINGLNLNNQNALDYANLDISYMIPKNINGYNDLFTRNIKNFNIEKFIILILIIGAIGILILTITAFAIPYALQKQVTIAKLFNKMFLELKFLIWIGFALGCVGILQLLGSGPNQLLNYVDMISSVNGYFYLIGIPTTFILYLLIYLNIGYIKYIYHTGFMNGFIKNSIFGRILFYLLDSTKKLAQEIIEMDTTREYQIKFLMILGINLMALCFIALAGPLGLVLAIVYTIFLFIYLIKLIDKIRSLNIYSSQLAKGDFDALLPEEIGILSPIAKNLNNIKSGFKVAIDKEIRSQHMKTELISNVSHDLKTPLTSIITYVDLLKNMDITKETQSEYIDILDKKSKRLQILIEDLFEASKASSGNIELQVEQVDVIALFRQTLGELEEKINDSNLQMRINLPDNKVICELDGRRSYRVFENIIGNILKYALPNSRVYIDVLEAEKQINFIFKNISAYEMNFDASEIMERFSRGDASRNTEGSGLGLSIAKSLVELQKGSLEVNIDGDLFKLTVTFSKV